MAPGLARTPRLKVCCIASIAEAELAVRHGASALGLVSSMPSGPGVIPEPLIRAIAGTVPPGVATVLLTSETEVDRIIDQQRRCRVNTIQLVDEVAVGDLVRLREALPGISIVPVVHVTDKSAIATATAMARAAHALLLDSGNPLAAVKELGGTGRTHDWSVSRRICETVATPVFLAGGLTADNVAAAVRQVRPYGVDVCSGLRDDGRLDEEKLVAFTRALWT